MESGGGKWLVYAHPQSHDLQAIHVPVIAVGSTSERRLKRDALHSAGSVQKDVGTVLTTVRPPAAVINVGFDLVGPAIVVMDDDIEVVISAAQVIVAGCKGKPQLGDSAALAGHGQIRVDTEARIGTGESMRAGGCDHGIHSGARSDHRQLRHIPVVFAERQNREWRCRAVEMDSGLSIVNQNKLGDLSRVNGMLERNIDGVEAFSSPGQALVEVLYDLQAMVRKVNLNVEVIVAAAQIVGPRGELEYKLGGGAGSRLAERVCGSKQGQTAKHGDGAEKASTTCRP